MDKVTKKKNIQYTKKPGADIVAIICPELVHNIVYMLEMLKFLKILENIQMRNFSFLKIFKIKTITNVLEVHNIFKHKKLFP